MKTSLYIKAYSPAFPSSPLLLLRQKSDHTSLPSPLWAMLCPSGIIIGGAQKVWFLRMGSVLALALVKSPRIWYTQECQ